ncbi:MAG: Ig-like domain-containing protein [Bacteroidales bacterium]|nr:Ig-like domain-containing protein [Bacteroidales bacterium]
MKKNIFSALLCALAIVAVAACNRPEEKLEQQDKNHTVTFEAQVPSASETKTALMLKVVPDWRNTDVNDVHIFETETPSAGNPYFMEATKVEMTTPVDGSWEKAYFYAEFDNATVIVNPPSALTKAGSTFAYTALMATRENDKYLVPSLQQPHVESLIDPKADFLIGKCSDTYSSSRHGQRVFLEFLRPVALSRLAITNLEGSYIESVKINCVENTREYNGIITGEVAYSDVDFETSTADFQANANAYELTMKYPDGLRRTATSYVYMVTVPGTKSVQSVEVVTDKYIYTKTYATPVSLTFYASEFINIAMDMTVKEGGNTTRVAREAIEMEYQGTSGDPVDHVVYDIYSNDISDFGSVAPTLYISNPESAGTVTFVSGNTDVATVDQDGNVTLTGLTGETTITATATGNGLQYVGGTATYKITVVNNSPKVTYYKAASIDAGYDYMIVSADNALSYNGESLGSQAVTVDEQTQTISLEQADGILWTAEAVEESLANYGTHSFSHGAGHLMRLSESGSYSLVASDGDLTKYMVWDYDGTNFRNISIYESTVTSFYAYYSEGWKIASSGYGQTALYTARMPQTPVFETETVAFDIYNDADTPFTGQAVSEAKTNVTYSIDNEAVATIDPATGAVEVIGEGTAVITATAAASDNYQGAVATYTLNVTDSTPGAAKAKYVKVTDVSSLEVGNQYILVYEGGNMAFYPYITGSSFTKSTSNAIAVEINNGVIESDDLQKCHLTLEQGYYLKSDAENMYLYPGTSGSSSSLNAEETATNALTIGFTSAGIAEIKCGNYYLVWSTYSSYFSCNTAIEGNYQTGICLYMLDDGRQSQTIAFSAAEAAYDVYAGAWEEGKEVPTLSGAQTTVTYASSNEAVATVDPSTGAVTLSEGIKSCDKAVITATAAKDETYRAATASYTINITSSDPADPVYTKVLSNDDLEPDGQYLLVYESASAVFKPILNGSAFTKSAANVQEVQIVNNTITSKELGNCVITFEDGKYLWIESAGKYLYPGASGNSALGAEDKTESHTVAISIDANGIATIARASDATYHLYWSSSNYFSGISQTGSSYAANICLYKLDDGRTPQNMSFSANAAEYDVFVSNWVEGKGVPALSGAETDVTYASSNESVATVDPTSGAVTIASGVKKGDKAVITATAEANATFKKGKASYTINIVNSNPAKVMYSKVTSADEVVADGSYVFVYRSGSTVKAFKPVLNSGKTAFQQAVANAVDVTITDDQIDADDVEGCEIVLTNQDGTDLKFSMVVPAADGVNDYYFVLRNSSTNFVASTTENGYRSSFAISSTGALTIKRDSYNFRYSSSSNYFQSSTSSASSLELFKLDDNQPKKRNLAFSASEASVNVYGLTLPYAFAGAPTLSGKTDGVTYSVSCSDASVASSAYPTVSAAGAVTINGTGVFTVKASAPATAELQADEASYTLTVISEAASSYTKVSSITSGATYLIVSTDANNYTGLGGKRAFAGDQAGTAVEVESVDGTITGDYSACEFTITAEGDAYVLNGPEGYVTGNSSTTYSRYIRVSSTKGTMSLTDAATLSAAKDGDGLVEDAFYFYYTKTSGGSTSIEVLYFNSDGKYKVGGTGRKYGVYLYKKN